MPDPIVQDAPAESTAAPTPGLDEAMRRQMANRRAQRAREAAAEFGGSAEPTPAPVAEVTPPVETAADPAPVAEDPKPDLERAERERQDNERRIQREQAEQERATQRREKAVSVIGPEDEYQRLSRLKARNESLDFEDDEKLERWTKAREHLEPVTELVRAEAREESSAAMLGAMTEQLQKASGKPGVDTNFLRTAPDMTAILDHFYDAGVKSVAGDLQEQITAKDARITQLESELRSLRGQAAGAPRAPERGGRTSTLPAVTNPRGATPLQKIQAGLREGIASRAN